MIIYHTNCICKFIIRKVTHSIPRFHWYRKYPAYTFPGACWLVISGSRSVVGQFIPRACWTLLRYEWERRGSHFTLLISRENIFLTYLRAHTFIALVCRKNSVNWPIFLLLSRFGVKIQIKISRFLWRNEPFESKNGTVAVKNAILLFSERHFSLWGINVIYSAEQTE